ncbi:terminal uridylyltransferase 4 [Chanos chanos]|uniref:RNA uridylyltransferase n=1 Tax=Chanos chanos TaxID=29144 RepID=A0A6J2WC47_CHACN|nr:terminal uridylyltransferase 4 [Chanos chanos]
MDESKSPLKSVKSSHSEVRGGSVPTSKPQKDASPMKESIKTSTRSKENISRAKEEHQGSHGSGRTLPTANPLDQGRGKGRGRLTGRARSGERSKGKGNSQTHQVVETNQTAQGSSRDNGAVAVPRIPEDSSTQTKPSKTATVKEKLAGGCDPSADAVRCGIEPVDEGGITVDDGDLTSEQQLGLKQAEERLRRDYIHRLVKQSPEYPNFQYLCKLCSVHVENIQGAHKHIKEKRHKKNIMEKQEENELRALPAPSAAQLRAVDAAVLNAAQQHGISDKDFEQRQAVVLRMEKIIKKHLPDCSLRLYGSCLTRFAFKTSDINIDVTYPSSMTQPDVLIQVLEILKNSEDFSEVESDFHAKVPVVFCRDSASGLMCKVSAGNEMACLTTNHLAALARLEPRLVPLVLAFRYWARLCHIDCQAEGGIPSYSFSLMVIFFLQQRKESILPVYLGHWVEGFDVKQVDEYHLTGLVSDVFVGWEHRLPSASEGRGGENKAKPEPKMPVGNRIKNTQGRARLTFEHRREASLGQLWLELLRFYTLEFALEEHIISIRLRELLPREVKNWPRRRLAIEDPFALKRNVARSLNSQMVFEYIQERFRTAYKYFACPQSRKAAGSCLNKPCKRTQCEPKPNRREKGTIQEGGQKNEGGRSAEDKNKGVAEGTEGGSGEDEEGIDVGLGDEEELSSGFMSLMIGERGVDPVHDVGQEGTTSQEASSPVAPASPQNGLLDSEDEEEGDDDDEDDEGQEPEVQSDIAPEDLHYIFDRMIFTGGKPPTVVCSICKRDGHLKDECPEDFKKIELKPLPPMTERFRDILDNLCKLCYHELSPSLMEQQKREQILAGLERFIRKEYNEKAQLCLFGSSKNGFGFRDSDLDICMTLEGHDTAEKLNCKEIIEGLAKVLKKHTGLRNILPITTAKVPIVKFEHKQSGLEGDISLYNTLAQHNTRMLATYAAIDPRVQYLGYTMKVFAKRCDIGDASRGSLSSYAYILMVLYFLQQRQPPVIPVLQEIFDGKTVPQRMVDGWNAFFFDDLDELRRRSPELCQNHETVGELWLGLLRFYTEEFDFKEHVISIRQRKRLTTFEKQWTSKCIAIEDPFDLNHNLGAGVSRKMTNFIMKAFINGRKLFGTPFYPQPGLEAEYFFDSKVLTDGELAPNDRCCRICGKIGHYMKDCPKRRRMKKKENEKDEEVKEEEREPRERRCFQCGDAGHVRRDCPEYRHLRQRASACPVPHMVRAMVSSQSIPIPQSGVAQEHSGRTRQPSECSDTRQTPPFSPQPVAFSQGSSQSSVSPSQSSSSQGKAPTGPSKQPQVQLPLFGFPHTQFPHAHHHPHTHPGLSALGILSSQAQGVQLAPTSWPIHGPVLQAPSASVTSSAQHPSPPGIKFPLHSASGNGGGGGVSSSPSSSVSQSSPMNLNDPSIIFAQPAAAGRAPGRDGHHWHHNHQHNPGALVGNGAVGKSEPGFHGQFGSVSQGSRSWDHSNNAHYTLSPSWSYRMPQNYLQQGNGGFQHNKPYISQGSVMTNQHFPLLQPGRHHNLNFIQQKK